MTYNPWAAAATVPELHIDTYGADLPSGHHGRLYPRRRLILIARTATQVQRRCTLAHELVHAERGDLPTTGWFGRRQERTCEQLAARRLIDLDDLISALHWSQHEAEVADELRVDVETLRIRVDHLHPTEVAYVRRALRDML